MKWLEIINIRSASVRNSNSTQLDLKQLQISPEKETGLIGFRFLRHATLKHDVSLHLLYEGSEEQVKKSQLGVKLAALFKEFGLVNHSLWVLEDDQTVSSSLS